MRPEKVVIGLDLGEGPLEIAKRTKDAPPTPLLLVLPTQSGAGDE